MKTPFLSQSNCLKKPQCRGVAQSGSAPVLGTGGREFESRRPDHFVALAPIKALKAAFLQQYAPAKSSVFLILAELFTNSEPKVICALCKSLHAFLEVNPKG